MPLLRFDLVEGRTDDQLAALLGAAHEAVLDAFNYRQLLAAIALGGRDRLCLARRRKGQGQPATTNASRLI